MSEVASDDWVAVAYPQTGAVRLFPSIALAKLHVVAPDLARHCYKSALDLRARHDHRGLENFWRKLFDHSDGIGWPRSSTGPEPTPQELEPPDCSTEVLAGELWSLMLRVGDRVRRASAGTTRPKDHYEIFQQKIAQVLESADFKKAYPRQCQLIIQSMHDLDEPYVLEDTLKKMMLQLLASGKLKTKQDDWLIFMFYRARLIKDGLISRGPVSDENQD